MVSVKKLLLLVLCGYHCLPARADYKVLATGSQKAGVVCGEPLVTPSSSSGATVQLSHRYGPCSPVASTDGPSIRELLRRDQLRAEYIERKFSSGNDELEQSAAVTVPTNLGEALDTLEYVITVGIGSPAVKQTMIIDTGSDVSWVQCKPCPVPPCHAPNGSLFDPAKSTTYVPFSCSSAPCAQLGGDGNGCSRSQCQYIVRYGDGSNTTGTYGSDTLALAATSTVSKFQFGCSHNEDGFDDQTDGLMGLGGDVESLVSQTAATYGKAFSYCLPATTSTPGFLTLGAPNSTSGFVTTPMLRSKTAPTFYRLLLEDIRVDGSPLGISPTVFTAGSVMDSGTVITRLPTRAYSALRSAFRARMTKYPKAPPLSPFDTCYDFTGLDNVTIPSVALVFGGGAVVDLDANGIILEDCLAFAGTSGLSLIGNVQQRTFEVLHNVGQSVFGFRSAAC
ncbi:aspartyl protease family protein At5g10770 [Lolium perenne]|uniref:aspartyl protease family protein At5g10770 n=1 Tax=Lolium perenne TaxID=4522 RepID=UPI0021EA4974|nr:aspartyl protease family protein At5g10770-like [Lolium perenne]